MRKLMCIVLVCFYLRLFAGQHLFLDGEQNKVIKVIDKAMLEERIDHDRNTGRLYFIS